MASKTRATEADNASVAFQIALTQIGAKTIEDALTLWADVPPDLQPATASRWLGRATRLVLFRRQRSQALALAYYRLARALRTGTTVADPYNPEPTYVSLNDLRREFGALVTPVETGEATEPDPEPETQVVEEPEPERAADPVDDDEEDDDLILVEEIKGLGDELDRIEKAAEAEIRERLAELGPKNSARKQSEIDTSRPADEVDAERAEAHQQAGNRQAADAERIAMNGARSAVYATGTRDPRVIGWIRLSRTGTPCGWCAMLISRGPVDKGGRMVLNLYGSKKAAGGDSIDPDDPDKYHTNCKCYAMPVYSVADYQSSDLYALNRLYANQWPTVTNGLSGKAALSAWRAFIRRQQKAPVQATAA